MAEQKLIKLKINEREVQVPQGTLVIDAAHGDGSAVVLLLPRLVAASGVPHVPGGSRKSAEAADRVHAGGDGRDDRSNGHRAGAPGAQVHAGIPADESP